MLFLSARGAVSSRVERLSASGDDYLPKPLARGGELRDGMPVQPTEQRGERRKSRRW